MMKRPLLLFLIMQVVLGAAWGQSGASARNQAGDSARASDDSSYVEIPPDIPPELFFTITYNLSTPLEGIPNWYDVKAGSKFLNDFKREFTAKFSGVQMAMPMAFLLGRKAPKDPYPLPEFTVTGAVEVDSKEGKAPNLPYDAYYMTDHIADGFEVVVKDILKSHVFYSPTGSETRYRWSLRGVGKLEPVAITSSLLFKLPPQAVTLDTQYGLIVPFSEGGNYLSNIEAATGKPDYNPRLRAVYLHKPKEMKAKIWWEPADALKAWHTPFKARTDNDEYYANGEIQNGHNFVYKDDANPIFVEMVSPEKAKLKWGAGGKYHAIDVIPVDMAVDANRDGVIKFAGNVSDSNLAENPLDKTEKTKPFCVWINSDNDGTGDGAEDVEGAADCNDTEIKSKRDLEDFFRLHLYFGGLQAQIADGTYTVGLKWKSVTGSPSIKIYQAVETDGSTGYLTDDATAASQIGGNYKTAKVVINQMSATMLPLDVFSGLGANANVYLLFEAAAEGKGRLVLTLHDSNGIEIGEGPSVWLELKNVKQMYARATATPDTLAKPYESDSPTFDDSGFSFTAESYTPPQDEEQKALVFVHGWNMSYNDYISFSETMFKRMWHQGFKGRFCAFRWATLTSVTSYNTSEYRAWKYGKSLKSYVESLPGNYVKNVAAHSMGNVVMGSALQRGMSVNCYFLMQAAIPGGCYNNAVNNYSVFISKEQTSPTPDTVADLGYRLYLQTGYANVTKAVNFYNQLDFALATGSYPIIGSTNWEENQISYKPDANAILQGNKVYAYDSGPPNNPFPIGQRCFLKGVVPPFSQRSVTDIHESMACVARPRSKAIGAEPNSANVIQDSINLASYSFDGTQGDHSGQFNRRIQQLSNFYQKIFSEINQ